MLKIRSLGQEKLFCGQNRFFGQKWILNKNKKRPKLWFLMSNPIFEPTNPFLISKSTFQVKISFVVKINLRGQEILGSKIYFATGNLFWSRKLSWGKKSIVRYKIYPGVKMWFLGIEIDAHRLNNPHTNQATYFLVQGWLN